jgi:hypothetical protein
MSESHNGQSQIQRAPKPRGTYTGERLSGAKYQAIVDAAAQGASINDIARTVGVTWRTANAVVARENRAIAVRKQELLDQSLRIARRAANQIEAKINDKATLSQLVPVYGCATDKVALLSAADPFAPSQHIHMHLQPVDVCGNFNRMLRELEEKTSKLRELEEKTRALPAPQSLPNASEDPPLEPPLST